VWMDVNDWNRSGICGWDDRPADRSTSVRRNRDGTKRSGLSRQTHAGRFARGFTLVEALTAVSVSSIACTAVLLTMTHSLMQNSDQVTQTLAVCLAQNMMDEVSSKRFYDPDPSPSFGIEPNEQTDDPQQQTREPFDDIDDFDGWEQRPPLDLSGRVLGTQSSGQTGESRYAFFRRRVRVEYVRLSNHASPAPDYWMPDASSLAAHVTVEIEYKDRIVCVLHKLLTFDEQY
jgi:type II secretory pathway pseudopilin PulG